jgi:hypothetical protein
MIHTRVEFVVKDLEYVAECPRVLSAIPVKVLLDLR